MNTNCPHHFTGSKRPLEFKLPAFNEHPKLAFVDSVCRTLMKSRFGDGAMYTPVPRFRGTADEPFSFLDLLEEEPFGWHEAAKFLGRTTLRRTSSGASLQNPSLQKPGLQKPARSKGIGLDTKTSGRTLTTLSPATLARGSPTFPGRAIFQPSWTATAQSHGREPVEKTVDKIELS